MADSFPGIRRHDTFNDGEAGGGAKPWLHEAPPTRPSTSHLESFLGIEAALANMTERSGRQRYGYEDARGGGGYYPAVKACCITEWN